MYGYRILRITLFFTPITGCDAVDIGLYNEPKSKSAFSEIIERECQFYEFKKFWKITNFNELTMVFKIRNFSFLLLSIQLVLISAYCIHL